MKRVMMTIAVVVVLMGMTSTALAGSWGSVLGNSRSGGYGYNSYGGIIGQVGDIYLKNKALNIAKDEQEHLHQQTVRESQKIQVERQRTVEWAQQAGKIQHLKDENEALRKENAELKKQLEELRKEVLEMKQMLEQLLAAQTKTK